MAHVKAGPNEYLVVGRGGKLRNLGTAIRTFLLPGSVHVILPSIKQEASFEMTHESKDGIPLRFKGIVIYRITDPVAAAHQFDFTHQNITGSKSGGVDHISELIGFISMGELRSIVSDMTMEECIKQRKTTLTQVVQTALKQIVEGEQQTKGELVSNWGIQLEVVQVSQVFIVDEQIRRQLEAETRNEIKVNSEKSDIQSQEEIKLTKILSEQRLEEERLKAEKENISRKENLELTQIAYQRRMQQETLETHRKEIAVAREEFSLQQGAEREKIELEMPLRQFRAQKQREVLEEELEMRRLAAQVKALEVEAEVMLETARQQLQVEILPLEQIPQVVEAASQIFRGTNLSIYGDDGKLFALVAPLTDLLCRVLAPLGQAPRDVKNG
jgi:hypothetical protein